VGNLEYEFWFSQGEEWNRRVICTDLVSGIGHHKGKMFKDRIIQRVIWRNSPRLMPDYIRFVRQSISWIPFLGRKCI